ncbi:hypothetical protein STCU_11705 [Strigomonas culicis]|uniref:Uncharacterized protein n=1 Tax=Strigomonas culicis TaxID=28005 RepID=S9THQ2_9TRYP|nr:hypothetical protein STCU_11705 [Strigomonas culicis]|eukprot:EPY15868.1 hypothetical protein STCU_11705 [Strigomonas culicis]
MQQAALFLLDHSLVRIPSSLEHLQQRKAGMLESNTKKGWGDEFACALACLAPHDQVVDALHKDVDERGGVCR